MIKIMIVDDEPWIRTSLKNRIDWSEELILCGEASDGFEALQLAANLRPDILITDVRMPEMSGLALIERLHDFLPDMQSVIISGYNEFEYVKSAIELGSCGYVLKPVRKEELNKVIQKAIDNISQNNLLRLTTQTQAKLLDQLLINLYHETFVAKETFLSTLKNLHFFTNRFSVLMIRFLTGEETADTIGQRLNTVAAALFSSCTCCSFRVSDTVYGIFLTSADPVDLPAAAKELIRQLQIRSSLDVSISIGAECRSFEQLGETFRSAREGLHYMHLYNSHEIILPAAADREHAPSSGIALPGEITRGIIDSIYAHSITDLNDAIGKLNDFIQTTPDITLYDINNMLYLMLGDLIRICYERNASKELCDKGIAFMQFLSGYQPQKDFVSQFAAYCWEISSSFQETPSIVQVIHNAEQYIRSRYYEDISLRQIASLFYLNPSYFSVSFKNVTGKNFNEYLTSVRMENAKQMLLNKSLRVNQIARMTGYDDCSYFSKAFRKYTGMMPSEYQQTGGTKT